MVSDSNADVVVVLGRVESGLAEFRTQVADLTREIGNLAGTARSQGTAIKYISWIIGGGAVVIGSMALTILSLSINLARLPTLDEIKKVSQPPVAQEFMDRMDRGMNELLQKRSDAVIDPGIKGLGWHMVNGSEYAYLENVKLQGAKASFQGIAAAKGAFSKIANNTAFIEALKRIPADSKFVLASDNPKMNETFRAILAGN